jgi:hypothetical protein
VPLGIRPLVCGRARWIATIVVAVALTASLMAACSSGSSSSATPTSKPGATSTSKSSVPTTAATNADGSGASSVPKSCPAASVVNAALGQRNNDPVSTAQPFGITCTYHGGGAVPTKIQFQTDMAATFAAGKNAVATAGETPVTVPGLGDSAYVVGGFLAVLKGSVAIEITSPLSTPAQVEALARQILG